MDGAGEGEGRVGNGTFKAQLAPIQFSLHLLLQLRVQIRWLPFRDHSGLRIVYTAYIQHLCLHLVRVQHQLRSHLCIELLCRQKSECNRCLFQRRAFLVSLFGAFRHICVASVIRGRQASLRNSTHCRSPDGC